MAGNCHLLAAQHHEWGSPCYEGFRLALATSGPYATSSYRGARARRPRHLGVAFVRPIMNSPSFVEGGSFLLAPSKLRSLRRGRGGKEGGVDVQGEGAIYEPTLPL